MSTDNAFSGSSGTCRFDGCKAHGKTSGYCPTHYARLWDRTHRQTGGKGGRDKKLTDEQVAEIRKRSSRFQSAVEIGRAMGISDRTVRNYLKAAR